MSSISVSIPISRDFHFNHENREGSKAKATVCSSAFNKIAGHLIEKTGFLSVSVLNIYHFVKQNCFLNTENKEASSLLESGGNVFLSPVRYLFNGKTVTEISPEGSCKMYQSFDYTKDNFSLEVLKTALAIFSLPISLLIGGTIKGLSLLSPSVREKQHLIYKDMHVMHNVNHEAHYQASGITSLFSNEKLEHKNMPIPELKEKLRLQMQTVKDVSAVLEGCKIPHWLDCGTLLGAYRHGSMIPWDTDVDMGILADDHTNVMHALRQLDPQKYIVQDWSSCLCPKMFIRVLIKETNSYLDIYHHVINSQDQTICYKYAWTHSPWVFEFVKKREIIQQVPIKMTDVFPLKKADFGGVELRVPSNWEEFLKLKYGENINPCRVWNRETQKYDKIPDHPYWQHSDF